MPRRLLLMACLDVSQISMTTSYHVTFWMATTMSFRG
jgi:hypothetical protein